MTLHIRATVEMNSQDTTVENRMMADNSRNCLMSAIPVFSLHSFSVCCYSSKNLIIVQLTYLWTTFCIRSSNADIDLHFIGTQVHFHCWLYLETLLCRTGTIVNQARNPVEHRGPTLGCYIADPGMPLLVSSSWGRIISTRPLMPNDAPVTTAEYRDRHSRMRHRDRKVQAALGRACPWSWEGSR